MPEITWMANGKDSYDRNVIWFKSEKEKPSDKSEFVHSDWEYFCDGKLDGQELERFMMKHCRLCNFKEEHYICKENKDA